MTPEELLSTTRSVRRRLDFDRPVDLRVVRECLRLALQAPNGGNRQDWRWIVVDDPSVRTAIGDIYRSAFERRYPPGTTPEGFERGLLSARHLAANLHRVPVLVIPCLDLSARGLPSGNQAGVWGSLLPAAWSYALAARARGLATAWTTVHLDAEQRVAALLGLPEGVRQGALIPTAHHSGTGFSPARRDPVETVMHMNGWRS